MSVLKPSADTLITMARKVYEKSELNFLNISFSIETNPETGVITIIVNEHDDKAKASKVYERVSIDELVASYIGLSLTLDLDANDAVTKGHRLGRTFS